MDFPIFLVSQEFLNFLPKDEPGTTINLATDAVYFKQHNSFQLLMHNRQLSPSFWVSGPQGERQTDVCPVSFSGGFLLSFQFLSLSHELELEQSRRQLELVSSKSRTCLSVGQKPYPIFFLYMPNSLSIRSCTWKPFPSTLISSNPLCFHARLEQISQLPFLLKRQH